MLMSCNSKCVKQELKLYVDVDNCSTLWGGLIMAEDNYDGEQTLKRGDDTYKKCR
jgi:hypothetical protein